MQSRFALTAAKCNRVVLSTIRKQFPAQLARGGATTSGRTADPAEHAVEEEDVYPSEAIHEERRRRPPENEPTSKDNESYIPPKPPKETAPKLESHGVGPRTDPILQQKRRNSATTAGVNDVNCAGIDGGPWPSENHETDRRSQREEQEREDKEYYKHHKASPLSEIEVSDTRKPASQVTDGTAQSVTVGYYGGDYGNQVWRPEQLDTAEESLLRAAEIFRMNAMRGDPDSPHGRVLRRLRGEDW